MGKYDELVKRLNAAADDPMWADHAEVSKATLRKAATAITTLEAELAAMKARGDKLTNFAETVAEFGSDTLKELARQALTEWRDQ